MAAPNASFSEGTFPYIVDGSTYYTYYKLFGSLTEAPSAISRSLIVLHGGPGMAHDYLLPLSDLSLPGLHGSNPRPVLFYDQIGNGRSTRLWDKPQEFFTVELFVNELAALVAHFGFEEYDIIGHSWGGMLVAEYEVQLQPPGLKSIIITNSLAAVKLRIASTIQLLQAMGDEEVLKGMTVGFQDPKRYRAALEAFHAQHACLVRPIPKEVVFGGVDQIFGDKETGEGGDPTVSINMVAGATKDWTIVDRLHKVRVPTFVINGRKDFCQEFVSAPYFWNIRKSKWVTLENSSHMPMWEEREKYIRLVAEWLDTWRR